MKTLCFLLMRWDWSYSKRVTIIYELSLITALMTFVRFSSVIFYPLRIARLKLNRFQFSQVGWKLTNWSKQFISRTGSCRFNCTRIRDENFQFENCSNESAGRGKNVNSRRWRWTSRHDRVETRPRSFRLLPLLLLRNVYLNFTFDEITSNINFHLDIVVISRK